MLEIDLKFRSIVAKISVGFSQEIWRSSG